MGFLPHLAEVERLNSKLGQSETSLSKQTFPREMGHFVPLDKRDLLYLHLVLPVPHSSSLKLFLVSANTSLNALQKTEPQAALCCSSHGPPPVQQGKWQQGHCNQQQMKKDFLSWACKQLVPYTLYFSIWENQVWDRHHKSNLKSNLTEFYALQQSRVSKGV